jgi:hypothetical protein
MKKKLQPTPADTAGVTVLPQDRLRGSSPPEWKDNSGEGAASALESLRKREQSRRSARPSDDRELTQ